MSKIGASYGLNIDKATVKFSNIRKHNYRDKQKFADKNIHINWKWTKWNKPKKFFDWRKKLEDYARPYVKKYNQRQRKQGHAKRIYKSVDDYLKKNAKNATRCGLVSIGDTNFRKKFEHDQINKILQVDEDETNKVSKDKILLYLRSYVEPKALINYAKDFNKRHKYIKWSDVVVHVDESFLHFHGRLVALPGYTKRKNGKRLSFSINKALQREYPNAIHSYHLKTIGRGKNKHRIRGNFKQHDGRLALHELNKEEAPNLINSLKKFTLVDSHIELFRKGHWIRHRDNFWQIKQSEAADKLQKSTIKNDSAINSVNSQTNSIKSRVAKAHDVINRASSANAELNSIQSKVKKAYDVINSASDISKSTTAFNKFKKSYCKDTSQRINKFNAQFTPQQMNSLNNQYQIPMDSLALGSLGEANYDNSLMNDYNSQSISSASASISAAEQRHKTNISEYHQLMYHNFRLFGIGKSTSHLYANSPKSIPYLLNELDYHIQGQKDLNAVQEVKNNMTDYEKNKETSSEANQATRAQSNLSANYNSESGSDSGFGL